MLGRYIDMGWW